MMLIIGHIRFSLGEYYHEVENVHMQISKKTNLIEKEAKYYRGTKSQ